uniref:Uncharacterized protein n=1 Tax=Crocodylus porosus TaxID=8502 RepID=A0A7M4F137_CROPO
YKPTGFAEPFPVLSGEFLFACLYLLQKTYLHICHKSHSFAEPVFLLLHCTSLLNLLITDEQHFCLSHTSPLSLHSSTSSKEHVKYIHGGSKATTRTTLFNGLFTSFVIQVSLLGIRENFICLRNLFELQQKPAHRLNPPGNDKTPSHPSNINNY